ncbi:MAG TPA: LptF/LptG family permease [Acidobacteriota bacterium]
MLRTILRRLRPKIVDRYVFTELLPPAAIGLLLFTFALLMNTILDKVHDLIRYGVGLIDTAKLLGLSLPFILALTLPTATLIGILIGVGRLSADSEIVALRCGGYSLYRIFIPVMAFAGCGYLITSLVMVEALPRSNQAYRELLFQIASTRALTGQIKPRVFSTDFPDVVLYVDEIPPGERVWRRIFLADTSSGAAPRVIVAQSGVPRYNRQTQTVWLNLTDGLVDETPLDDPGHPVLTRFDRIDLPIYGGDRFSGALTKSEREMSIAELKAAAAERERRGESSAGEWVEIHKKFSLPVACLVFGLIGFPLAITVRGGRSIGFLQALVLLMVYRTMIVQGEYLAEQGDLTPWLAMWAPNLLLTAAGLVLLNVRAEERSRGLNYAWARLRARWSAAPAPAARTRIAAASRAPRLVIRIPRYRLHLGQILDRYIGRQFLSVFLLVLTSLVLLFVVFEYVNILDEIRRNLVPFAVVVDYFKFYLPQIVWYMAPLAALMGTLVAFALLTRSGEITAMKASGIGLYRTSVPVFALALVLSGAVFLIQDRVLPSTNRRLLELRERIKRGPIHVAQRGGDQWVLGSDHTIYHYWSFDAKRNLMQNFSAYGIDPESFALRSRIHSARAVWQGDGWQLSRGWMRSYRNGRAAPLNRIDPSGERVAAITERPSYFKTEFKAPEQMAYRELERYVRRLERSGYDASEYRVDLAGKISWPAVPLIMALIGLPFAFRVGRHGAMFGVALSLLLAICYWVLLALFQAAGYAGWLGPLLAAWSANITFAMVALYLYLDVPT